MSRRTFAARVAQLVSKPSTIVTPLLCPCPPLSAVPPHAATRANSDKAANGIAEQNDDAIRDNRRSKRMVADSSALSAAVAIAFCHMAPYMGRYAPAFRQSTRAFSGFSDLKPTDPRRRIAPLNTGRYTAEEKRTERLCHAQRQEWSTDARPFADSADPRKTTFQLFKTTEVSGACALRQHAMVRPLRSDRRLGLNPPNDRRRDCCRARRVARPSDPTF
jgi:hypothetical protein